MKRLVAARFAAAGLLLAAGCHPNSPPAAPDLSGTGSAAPGDTVVFSASADDPEGDVIAYQFAWGDGSALEWTDYFPSGERVVRRHSYPDSGVYHVRAQARDDRGAESDWSDSLRLVVGFRLPDTPARPEGPETCTTGLASTFSVLVYHPLDDSLWVQFDWGGEVGNWAGPVPSGAQFRTDHRFDFPGVYDVRARAQDARGGLSGWSEPLAVTVVADSTGGGREPHNLQLAAASDSTVLLTWQPPDGDVPDRYRLLFEPVGDSVFAVIAETTGLGYVHDPGWVTGTYAVVAVYDTLEAWAGARPTTVPAHSPELVVTELNGTGDAGYGWKRNDGEGALYDMTSQGNKTKVDWYLTDWTAGTAGWPFSLASPHLGPGDPGGIVPSGNWRVSGLAGPLAEDDRLPPDTAGAYSASVEIDSAPARFGCRTEDGYFALVSVTELDSARALIRVESWFQTVAGLRLARH